MRDKYAFKRKTDNAFNVINNLCKLSNLVCLSVFPWTTLVKLRETAPRTFFQTIGSEEVNSAAAGDSPSRLSVSPLMYSRHYSETAFTFALPLALFEHNLHLYHFRCRHHRCTRFSLTTSWYLMFINLLNLCKFFFVLTFFPFVTSWLCQPVRRVFCWHPVPIFMWSFWVTLEWLVTILFSRDCCDSFKKLPDLTIIFCVTLP